MCALPLPEVLGDFEDAIRKISIAIVKISSSNLIHKQIPLIFLTQGDTAGQVWEWGGWGESGKIIKAFHENLVDQKIYLSGFGEGCQQDIQGKI